MAAGDIARVVSEFLGRHPVRGRRVLCIVPDGTRTAPLGALFREFHAQAGGAAAALDILLALGTHPPMREEQILKRLEWTAAERRGRYAKVGVFNHAWDQPRALRRVGVISEAEIAVLSGGLFAMDVPVEVNARIGGYDLLVVMGPVFPHEVAGFSGGNKYFFPGISGPAVLNFFHWLGAMATNPKIIGHARTPVRAVIDRAAALIPVERACFCMVGNGGRFAGLFAGGMEAAWAEAAALSARLHITRVERPFRRVISCAPEMYDELWVAGKCMYKLEPVVADGGELVIHAPHLAEISVAHGRCIREIGYHVRDYFWKQWDKFKHHPWGVLAHSTHVRGIGTFENGVEQARIRVTLATQIPRATCEAIHLGWRDFREINLETMAGREAEGLLVAPKAGEQLYRLVGE